MKDKSLPTGAKDRTHPKKGLPEHKIREFHYDFLCGGSWIYSSLSCLDFIFAILIFFIRDGMASRASFQSLPIPSDYK